MARSGVEAGSGLKGRCRVPGDKSISHRAALFSVLAEGTTRLTGYSLAADCQASLGAVRALGGSVASRDGELWLSPPARSRSLAAGGLEIDCARSGTTMRLLVGMLAGRPGEFFLSGDPQLLKRPMARVADPIRSMGARVELSPAATAPITIRGQSLHAIHHTPAVASAQVKSAVLLAGLQAQGETAVEEPILTRDHTERLLAMMGARLERELIGRSGLVRIRPGPLQPLTLAIPGDASSAAVIAAAAALVPGSDVVIEQVSLNPTRIRFLEVLERMGAGVEMEVGEPGSDLEPWGRVRVRQRPLRAVRVGAEEVPHLIDELPLLGLLATQAEGITQVTGAGELRVKESDRITGLVDGLRTLGAEAEELADGFTVVGGSSLLGGLCDSLGDHRLAMTFSLAGLISQQPVRVLGREFIPDSFPGFEACLRKLG
jgi:3-phosphoshikimate 1-carboxyvinyltransferase